MAERQSSSGFGPFLLRRRDGHSHVGNIERIGGFFFECALKVGQGFVGIAAAQKRESGAEFLERLHLNHIHFLHWAASTGPSGAIPRAACHP